MTQPLVSSKWLHEHLSDPKLIILDASLKSKKSQLSSDLKDSYIPGSLYFDLSGTFSDPNSAFPNTFPDAERFENGCRELGIDQDSIIVVYDCSGIYTSPRVWWMFKVMGHDKVYVLDGGLPDWVNNGYTTVGQYRTVDKAGNFKSDLMSGQVKDIDFVKANISNQDYLLVDARSAGRFDGTAQEPREGLRSGHIPNSINIPFGDLLINGKYKPADEIRAIFDNKGVDERPLVFSCGSGVTACILLLASEITRKNDTSVYDGSWTEWASLT